MANIRDITGKNRKFTGTTSIKLPEGTTAQRAGSPADGEIRFNTTTNLAEYYDGTAWKSIDSPPTITSFTIDGGSSITSGAINAATGGNATIVITGSLFDTTGAVVTFVGTSETLSTASISRDSLTQLTVTVARSGFDNTNEPYTLKVTNGSGLSAELAAAFVQNQPPVFGSDADTNLGTATPAGFTATGGESAVATDADGDTVTHTISAGSLPSGISMATNGSFSGTNTSGSAGTSTFTVSATDGTVAVTRQFTMSFNANYDVSYLVVAAGGGGGGDNGGGGGAGGYRSGSGMTLSKGTQYTVTVGTGGTGGVEYAESNVGGNSVFNTITSAGGGGGLGQDGSNTGGSADDGGSGGGVGQGSSPNNGAGNVPSVSPSQGNPGGLSNSGNARGGGGGGAATAGQRGTSGGGGTGGSGSSSSITGSSVVYAGGGGGGCDQTANTGAPGGNGGGGNGGNGGGNGSNGSSNLGGGAGGGAQAGPATGGSGGSGVVILSIPTGSYSTTTTGSPNVTTSGTNTILKFTGSGSYTA
tara:strand:+ start:173 stop:1762 length:1590 start_codon:yes stop_codon:yes gene_type:complete